jgi:RNA polymerase sigma-70 factor (ECF subfamily)
VSAALDLPVERLWHDLHGRIEAFVRRRVPSRADADDIVQDVFLKLHQGLRSAPLRDPEAYVYSAARNAIADFYRRKDAPAVPIEEQDLPDPFREMLAGCARPFLDQLPEPYREALVLTDLDGLTQAEAAARLGLSASGMRTRVQRGRARLRAIFDACCRFEFDRRGSVVACEPRGCATDC